MAAPNYDFTNVEVKVEDITHRGWRTFVGPLFIAPIETQLQSGIRVLKIGEGAGFWTADMAKDYPNSTFDLVHKDNYYPTQNTPASVTFQQVDIATEKLPYEDATFDVVVIRLLIRTIVATRWNHVFGELHRVLKPGGYLEITECDICLHPNEGPNRLLNEDFGKGSAAVGIYQHSCREIQKHFARLGLTTVSEKDTRWYINGEEFGPEILEILDFFTGSFGRLVAKADALAFDETEFSKHLADAKAKGRELKTHSIRRVFVTRK